MNLWDARRSIGKGVVYVCRHGRENGVITSVNDTWVFVRYAGDEHSKATAPEDLHLLRVTS